MDRPGGVLLTEAVDRPGVMDRLGLGYDTLAAFNPRIDYCAITGYGQTGPKVQMAAHYLNYVAEPGLRGLAAGAHGAPIVPPALIADIACGTYPAMIIIPLAPEWRDDARDAAGTRAAVARRIAALPLRVGAAFRGGTDALGYPESGEGNALIEG